MKLCLHVGNEHHASESMAQRYRENVEHVRLAREVGFDSLAIGDHRSYSGSVWFPPIEMLMGLAAAADGMSLGTCMLVLPLYNPMLVAEQIALLDAATGGRAIFGVSPGWQKEEFDLHGVDFSRRFSRYTESIELIRRLFTEDEVSFEGKHFRVAKLKLALKPTQKPRPPMWLGGSVENAVKRAAAIAQPELGDTWVASAHLKTDVILQQASIFKAELAALGKPAPKDFPVLRNIVVAPDRATAIRDVGAAIAESYKILGDWGLFSNVVGDAKPHPEFEDLIGGRFVIGSPAEAAEEIARIAGVTGATRMICRVRWAGMEHRHVMRSIELIGTRVAPLLRKHLG